MNTAVIVIYLPYYLFVLAPCLAVVWLLTARWVKSPRLYRAGIVFTAVSFAAELLYTSGERQWGWFGADAVGAAAAGYVIWKLAPWWREIDVARKTVLQ